MHRPKRIMVFGVLCLVFGGFILLHNLDQLGAAVGGPESIHVPSPSEMPGQFGQMLRDTATAMRGALGEPVYRVGLGIKSAISSAMAGLLIAVGVGLMRDRLWAVAMAKVWAVYAVGAAVVITVLQAVYVVPHIPAVSQGGAGMAGAQYVGMGLMLIVLCIYPALLVMVLPRKPVLAYMKNKAGGRAMPGGPVRGVGQGDRPMVDKAAASKTAGADSLGTTWRDDPWNDPGSR